MTLIDDTTVPAVEVGAVTREDLAAFKAADHVTFHHHPAGVGKGYPVIRLHLETWEDRRIWTAREQRLFPEPDSARGRVRDLRVASSIHSYESPADPDRATAFHMLNAPQFSDTWLTFVSLLRTGDTVSLAWRGGNNNGYLNDAGLHLDELTLFVARPSLSRPMAFRIGTSVCADNSARMIRLH